MIPRLRQRISLTGETGMALILAVLILAIVSIASAAAISYTTMGQKDAASKKTGVSVYSLAQAGLSNALAQLLAHYYDASGQPKDSTTSLTTMATTWAPQVSGSQLSPTSSAPCTSTSTCVTWSAVLNCPVAVSCPGGTTITVSGVKQAVWHVSATGKAPNPSAPGLLSRVITIDVPVNSSPGPVSPPDLLRTVYSGASSSGCDLTVDQGVIFVSPVYVVGNFCSTQHSGVEAGSQNLGKLVVGGWASFGQGGHVGTSTTPLSSLDIGKSCDGSQSATPCTLTKPSGQTYFTDPGGNIFVSAWSNSPQFPTPPTVDWTKRQTERGTWSCTGGRSLTSTSVSFSLTGSSYSCTSESGSMSWNGTTLTINGNIDIDGNLSIGGDFVYSGLGNIFSNGSASFANNTSICVGSTSHHDCPSGANWAGLDTNFLLILAKAGMSGSNMSIEGGLYSDGTINFGSGQTNIYGPIVTPGSIIPGQQAGTGFPNILEVMSGGPNSPLPYWTLGTPTNGTY